MAIFTVDEEKLIIWLFCQNPSPTYVRRQFLRHFAITGRATLHYNLKHFTRVWEKFDKHGIASGKCGNPSQTNLIVHNVATKNMVKQYFTENPRNSIRKAAMDLEMSKSSVGKCLKIALKWKPYKTRYVHKINPENEAKRDTFCLWFLAHEPNFCYKVVFGDEKWWVLDAEPNKKNSRFWSPVLPNDILETKYQGKSKVMSWVGILDGEILGPFWFLDDNGRSITVNQETYLQMLREKLWPVLENRRDLRRVWFQQDGAPAHASNSVLQWLHTHFGDRVISRRSDIPWPAQSPDLNPLDFWFWGWASAEVIRTQPTTIWDLIDGVETAAAVLTTPEIKKATKTSTSSS
jgi:hypothetical protein